MPYENDDDLFFETAVRGYVQENRRFVHRQWLANEIEDKLQEPRKRFVLLIGQPGMGKSSIMAQLAHHHPAWPRYFIRRDQRTV